MTILYYLASRGKFYNASQVGVKGIVLPVSPKEADVVDVEQYRKNGSGIDKSAKDLGLRVVRQSASYMMFVKE
jgi:hypothetical protein